MRVPRPAAFLSVILLHCTAAFAAETVVQAPTAVLVSTLTKLHTLCGPDGEFDACTRFVAYHLQATCLPQGASASINASVTFKPLIYLYNIRQLPHEQLHIDDIRGFAASYVAEIERLRFASREQCEAEALQAVSEFGTTMRQFATRSNRLRHPSLARMASNAGR
jgi:hypothetical protein